MDARERVASELLGKMVHVVVDRPVGYHHGSIVYPINYGYIPGVMAADGEEQDAYILGVSQPVTSFDGRVIGVIRRKNDCEDKLVVAPDGAIFHQGQIAEAVHFQEQYFDYAVDSIFQKSCGVLPYRVINGQQEYLIVYEQFSQCWSLPKGHMEARETESDTALRELEEETGLTAVLNVKKAASVEYPISPLARKQVVFFPGQVSGTPKVREGEIEYFRWVSADDLKNYLHPDTDAVCMQMIATL